MREARLPDTITIRLLGPDDVGVLDRVRPGTFDNDVDPVEAWAFLATGVNVLVVALSQGEVVGFASGTVLMHPDKRRGFFVNEVSVHEDLRRQGIGRRLMTRIMDVARDRACGDIWVATEGDNAPARALYRALGGAETTGIAMYDWPDEAG